MKKKIVLILIIVFTGITVSSCIYTCRNSALRSETNYYQDTSFTQTKSYFENIIEQFDSISENQKKYFRKEQWYCVIAGPPYKKVKWWEKKQRFIGSNYFRIRAVYTPRNSISDGYYKIYTGYNSYLNFNWCQGLIIDEKKEGHWECFTHSGVICRRIEYVAGVKHGWTQSFPKNGCFLREFLYVHGEQVCEFHYFENGNIKYVELSGEQIGPFDKYGNCVNGIGLCADSSNWTYDCLKDSLK